ncbi:hemagglutinin repeat-containing protein, partial [Polaromonas sp.]|uniref:hemagglutinin repeat-containing protein n=1 Tax=Polaromonas sp. TaxID=1869339 RepID=UPI001803A938
MNNCPGYFKGDADNYLKDSQSAELGSQIRAAGNLRLAAGADLNAKAAKVQAQGALLAMVGNDVNLTAGQQTNGYSFGLTTSESDFFGSIAANRSIKSFAETAGSAISQPSMVDQASANGSTRVFHQCL